TDDGQVVGSVWAQAGPGFFNLRGRQSGHEFKGGVQVAVNAGCRDRFVEADVFNRGAGENPSVVSGYKVNSFGPQDALEPHALATKRNHLSFRGPHRRKFLNAADLRRKRSGGDDCVARGDLLSTLKNEALASGALAKNGLGRRPWENLRAAALRGLN